MRNLNLQKKILLMTTIPVVVSVILLFVAVMFELSVIGKSENDRLRTQMLETKQFALKSYMDFAYSSISDLYEDELLDQDFAKQEALSRLNAITYGEKGDGYVFVYAFDGTNLANKSKPSLEGKNLIDLKDKNGVLIIKDLIDRAKKGGGYVEYIWKKPSKNADVTKLSYSIGLERWGWMLGTGFYIDDIEDQVATAKDELAAEIRFTAIVFLAIAALILIVVIIISTRFAKGTYTQLGSEPSSLDDIAKKIASGNLDVGETKSDDVGVYASMLSMRDDIRYRQQQDKLKAEEIGRVKQALDKVSSSVMMADTNYNIIYLNESLQTLFNDVEEGIQAVMPDFDASSLLGTSIDRFHQDPNHQRQLLESLSATHQADIKVGELSLRVIANPVVNDNGERIGTVVEWSNRTLEVAVQNEVETIVEAARHGDLTKRIDASNKSGFFLSLSEGMNSLVDVSETVIDETNEVLGALSNGDLTRKINSDFDGSFEELKVNINNTVDKLTGIIAEIKTMSEEVDVSSREIAVGNADLGKRTESQAGQLEQTAASVEEMSATLKQNAENSKDAERLASSSLSLAEGGGDIIQQAVASMEGIDRSSNQISEIINVIDEIAFQTNLLALNAAVEAARAGEHGRGFAVVASEVRSLAQKTADSAKNIKELILSSREKVEEGNALVHSSGESLKEIVESVNDVTRIISQIATANTEQAQGVTQISQSVTSMDTMTQQNAALVEEAAATSSLMSQKAKELKELTNFFKV